MKYKVGAMLRIDGIEASQAIQFFRSTFPLCTGPGGARIACADNSVPLVAQKPTVLRLYVSGATLGALVGGVATRPAVGAGGFGNAFTVAGIGSMVARPFGVTRTDPATTIQVILSPHVAGTYRFDVMAIEYAPNGTAVAFASSSITLDFVERRRIRIRLVRIHYTGRNMNVAAPTVRDFWDATDFAQRVLPLPSPGFEIVRESVEKYDGDFTRIDPTAHDPLWAGKSGNDGTTGSLLNILDGLVSGESLPADVIYVAIYPDNVRQSFAGWAVGRWIISDRVGEKLAHEILHQCGQPQHAPCGGPDNVDPNYPDFPAFSSLPAASIGEVGIDSLGSVYDPLKCFDLMAYCAPKWISPYNYVRCFNSLPPLPPAPSSPGSVFGPPDDYFVAVTFARIRDRWVVVDLPGFARPRPPLPPPSTSDLELVVLDDAGEVRARQRAAFTVGEASADDIPQLVEGEVPWIDGAAAVELRSGEDVLARMPTHAAPAIEVDFPSRAQLERGRGNASYKVRTKNKRIAVAVRASVDGGGTWTAVVSRKREGTVDVSALLAEAGSTEFGLLEVLATSGYHTASKRSESFRIPARARPILAWSSAEASGGRVDRAEPVKLHAIPADTATLPSELSWSSDLQGELGHGTGIMTVLRPGRHRVEVRSRTAFEEPALLEIEVE